MKRFVALCVAFVLILAMTPAALAYETPVASSNIDGHYYVNAQRWYTPIASTLEVTDEGYTRVECVDNRLVVEQYDRNFQFVSGQEIPLELPLWGGVYLCDDYNFVVVGQENWEEDNAKEVFRIIRYSKDWVRQASGSIYGANTTVPFDAGSLRFARSGDMLYIRTAHEMYADENGINHQANVMISVRISDMTVTDQLTKVWNQSYGYVSHSFNQFVLVDGNTLLAVDHGDYYPRSVVLFKYSAPAGQETFYSRVSYVNVLPIVSSSYHYNDTGVSVGGFEASSDHYLIAGCSADQTEVCDLMEAHRNIFVTATPKDGFTDEATTIRWLTSFQEEDDVRVSPPHLIKLSADRFFLIWTENGQIRYCTLDGKGELEGEIRSAEGDLSDCVPVLDGTKVVWYVTDNSVPQFYEIDPNADAHTHSYTSVVTEPTCQDQGYTTYTCTNCGDSYVDDYTDPVDHVYENGSCKWCGADAPNAQKCGDEAYWTYENGTLTIWGRGAMYDYCWDYLADENRPWADLLDQIHSVVVKDGITHIGEASFFWMPNLTAVSLPDSVLTIGRDALSFNPSLEEITLPGNLQEIHQLALQRCTALKELTLPASLRFVDGPFEGCTALKKVTILGDPELPVFMISNSVFRMCTALEEIQVVGEHISLTSVDNALYAGNSLNDYALNNPARELAIREGTERINQFAMQRAQNVEHIIIPASVNFVGIHAFAECLSLNTVTFLGPAPEIQEDIFWNDTLTVWYPANDPTWTADVMQDYGGKITWVPYAPPCDHTYEAVVTAPTCEDQGYTTYTCNACGDTYVADYTNPVDHVYEDGNCKWCGEADPYYVKWYSGTTSMNGTIDLNMYVLLGDALVNDPGTFVRFTFRNRTVDVPMADALYAPLTAYPNRYRFTCPMFAKQVADQVTVQVMNGEGPVGNAISYSVMQYCVNRIKKSNDANEIAMCKSLLNYGAAAQMFFNYNTDNLANASLSEADKTLATPDLSAHKYSITGTEEGIKAKSATVTMESAICIRVYFTLTGDKTIEDYTFTIDGREVQPRYNEKGWYIESEGIAAKRMDEMHDFCVGGITVRYSVLSYVNSKLKATDPLEVELAKALYAYYAAAEAYLG